MSRQQFIHVIDILRHAFGYQNPRLIHHGERVAYILWKMLEDCEDYTGKEKQTIFLLGLLHDIGAYADEEIDKMLSNDTMDTMDHSIFGYLLLKKFSPLSEYADCILYHHNHTAQYYPVPLSQRHREIARLIHMADRIDACMIREGADAVSSFLESQEACGLFFKKDTALFWTGCRSHHIREQLTSMAYLEQLDEYTKKELRLSEQETRDYLMTYLCSIDFRNDYTALHTRYALLICTNFIQQLHLAENTCKIARFGAMLHCIGKTGVPFEINSPVEFEEYLKRLYHASVFEVTRGILAESVSDQLLTTVEQSFQLLNCFLGNTRISFSPSPPAEIITLSYCLSCNWNHQISTGYLSKKQLMGYIRQKYDSCGLEDSILQALDKHYNRIVSQTQIAALTAKEEYEQMIHEMHGLQVILEHYNKKYL